MESIDAPRVLTAHALVELGQDCHKKAIVTAVARLTEACQASIGVHQDKYPVPTMIHVHRYGLYACDAHVGNPLLCVSDWQ